MIRLTSYGLEEDLRSSLTILPIRLAKSFDLVQYVIMKSTF